MSNKIRIDQSIQTFDVSIEYEGETYVVQPTVFSTASGTGTVTSVNVNGSNGIVATGGPIISSGVIQLAVDAPALIAHLGLVSNATHTGDAAGATALTLQPSAISGKPLNGGLVGTEEILINNGGVLQKTTIADLAVGGGAVISVNTQVGAVVLNTDDIADTATNRYTNDTDITRLANTSGTNTGDQVLPTNTSDLVNDGADGLNPFITSNQAIPLSGTTVGNPVTGNIAFAIGTKLIGSLGSEIIFNEDGTLEINDSNGNNVDIMGLNFFGRTSQGYGISSGIYYGANYTDNTYVQKKYVDDIILGLPTVVTDHTLLTNIGTNTHAQIDSHIADTSIHFSQASIAITASQVTDFDTEVSNNTDVAANTAKITNATHTGDVTGATALTISNDVVTNAKLANVATSTIKGRITAATGDPEDLTPTQVRTIINVEDGATANSSDATLLDRANHTGVQTASTISDFQTTVSANTDVIANTAKVSNATHTGDATGDTTLTLQPTAISGKGANAGLVGTEEVLINNAGTLEKTTTQAIADLGGGGGATLEQQVTQNAHGFIVGDAIKLDGTTWIKSLADLPANAGTLGVVSEVIDVNTFVYQYGGILTVGTWTTGVDYFLSPNTAGVIIPEPSYNIGEVREYIGTGTAQGLYINIDIGDEITELINTEEITKVANYTGLVAITGMSNEDLAYVTSVDIKGLFKYDSTLSATNNSGTIIAGWVRQYENHIIAHWFKGVDNDADMVNRALTAAGSTPVKLTKNITINRPILMDSNQTFIFEGVTITVPVTIADGDPFIYWNGHAVIKNRNGSGLGANEVTPHANPGGDWGGTGLGGETNITIVGGTIDGTGHVQYVYNAVQFDNVTDSKIENLVCNNVLMRTGRAQGNFDIRDSSNVLIINCESYNTEKSGIYIEESSNITVDGCYVTNTGDSGFISVNTPYSTLQNSWINACGTLNNSNATGNMQYGKIINNKFTNAPSSTHGFGFTLGHPVPFNAWNTIVTGNLFEGNALNGLNLQGAGSYGNIISDNTFIDNGVGNAAATAGGVVTNGNLSNLFSSNYFKANKNGIVISSGTNGARITDNIFEDQVFHGVHVSNGVNSIITNNIFQRQGVGVGVNILDGSSTTTAFGNIERDGAAYVEDIHNSFTIKAPLPLEATLWRNSLLKLVTPSPAVNAVPNGSFAGIAMATDGRSAPYGMTVSTRKNTSRTDFDLVVRAHKGTQAGVELFSIDDTGAVSLGTVKTAGYTVATLPTGVTGTIAYVTDAASISYRGTATGGGSDVALVVFDGTNWIYH